MREAVLDASLGRAECLLAEHRDEEALELWMATSRELERLDRCPQRLIERCDEVAAELTELGFAEQVERALK